MHGLFPQSEEFMFLDPEHIEEYSEWQCFAEFLEKEVSIPDELTPELKLNVPKQPAPVLTQLFSKEYQ